MIIAAIGPGTGSIVVVALIVLALVYYLVSTILAAPQDHDRPGRGDRPASARSSRRPRRSTTSSRTSTRKLDAGVDLLEGLLVKKAGMDDAVGLVEGLYPGAAAAGFRNFPDSSNDDGAAHRRGLHQGHADARPARPRGADRARPTRPAPVLRNVEGGQPGGAPAVSRRAPERGRRTLPRSPVIGTDAPVQYEQREDIGAPRKRLPGSASS